MLSEVAQLEPRVRHSVYDLRVQRVEAVLRDLQKMESLGRTLTSGTDWRGEDPDRLASFGQQATDALAQAGEVLALADETRRAFNRSRDIAVLALHQRFYRRVDEMVESANDLREHLMAADLGIRLQHGDPAAINRALIDWGIEESDTATRALEHIFTRSPRDGTDHRWREVVRQSTHMGLERWIQASTTRAARDVARRGVPRTGILAPDRPALDERDLEQIELRMRRARLAPRETVFAREVLRGATTSAATEIVGVKPSTGRTMRQRIRRKFSAVGDYFV